MIAAPCVNERIRATRLSRPVISLILAACFLLAGAQTSPAKEAKAQDAGGKKDRGELSWEMPGRVSIYDLQLGPATLKDNQWQFMGNNRTLNAGLYGERLTLMVRFSYNGSGVRRASEVCHQAPRFQAVPRKPYISPAAEEITLISSPSIVPKISSGAVRFIFTTASA